MSHQENKIGGAIFIPEMSRRVGDGVVEILYNVVGTDQQTIREAREAIEEEVGGVFVDLTQKQADVQRASFFFSSSAWKAPWEPKGHKPNWRTDEGTPIQ